MRELVENALDAGAESIRIEVRGGGLTLIAVSDDGQGIAADELPLAFARFATSKTLDPHDLEEVRTLGFRGEALAAVAAVSTVEAVSSSLEGNSAARVLLRNGELLESGRIARGRGTTIRVQDLFAEQPVRRGFLPPARVEHAFVLRLVRLYALARPEVKISLDTDGRRVFRAAGLGEAGALGAVFGTNASRLRPFGPHSAGDATLHGYLGDPGLTRWRHVTAWSSFSTDVGYDPVPGWLHWNERTEGCCRQRNGRHPVWRCCIWNLSLAWSM